MMVRFFQLIKRANFSTTSSLSMKANLRIIGGGGGLDTSASMMAFFDNKRYLFNCGEATQRICNEQGVKVIRFEHVFLNRINWDCIGGLPGFLLTSSDAGKRELDIYGPKNLIHTVASFRHYIGKPNIQLKLNEIFEDVPSFKDENLTIEYALIYPDNEIKSFEDTTTKKKIELINNFFKVNPNILGMNLTREQLMDKLSNNQAEKRIRTAVEDHPWNRSQIPDTKRNDGICCFIVKCADVLGKFDPKAAQSLGLKPGPKYKLLKEGKSVENEDGQLIEPHQCVGPSKKGAVFMVLECPSLNYIDSLINHTKIKPFINNKEQNVDFIFHKLGDQVYNNDKYLQFIKSFGNKCQHVIHNTKLNSTPINFVLSAQNQMALNSLDENIYQLPYHNNNNKLDLNINYENAIPGLEFQLEPNRKLIPVDKDKFKLLNDKDSIISKNLALCKEYQSFIKDFKSNNKFENVKSDGPFVSTLGTGSAIPSLTRNVSSNLITLKNQKMILLDCGEGTLGQLQRHLGDKHDKINQGYNDFLKNCRVIYISHPHADHHIGTINIMKNIDEYYQQNNLNHKLFYIAPYQLYLGLKEYSQVENIGLNRWTFINNYNLMINSKSPIENKIKDLIENLKEEMDLKQVNTCLVQHCQHAFGLSLITKDDFKLVYSGDTRPCDSLIELGKNCDVLIHEATMEDSLQLEAKQKRHSTVSEAFEQFKKMKAKKLVLTHFSQRYSNFVNIENNNKDNVFIASDLMCVDFNENSNDRDKFVKFWEGFQKLDNDYQKLNFIDQEPNEI